MNELDKMKHIAEIARKAAENVKFAWVTAEASLKEALDAVNVVMMTGKTEGIKTHMLDNITQDAEAISANVEAIALSIEAYASDAANITNGSAEDSIPAAINEFISAACQAAEMAAKASDNIALAIQSLVKNGVEKR